MKNIHLIPTDKPSRLHFWTVGKGPKLELCELEYSHTRNTQHIYITSDEEIKEGDWFYDGDSELCKYTSDYVVNPNGWNDNKKIILTTDQDLIKDGVQDIDDEFLEWFIKNPSCEEGEVDKNWNYPLDKSWEYKIIIPKAEQKQHLIDIMRGDEELGLYEEPKKFGDSFENLANVMSTANFMFGVKEEPKQETLEEFIEREGYPEGHTQDIWETGVRDGAQWQQERMYSKEDLRTAWMAAKNSSDFNEWFEQYKKK
jgi:hypothetical protein